MKKSEGDATTAKNLEEKFDRGDDVLDYFDGRKARVIGPKSKGSVKARFAYPMKRNSKPPAVAREKPAGYRKKK